MKLLPLALCIGMATVAAGCNDQMSEAEGLARGKLFSTCRYVYKTVEKIDICNMISQRHYDLEKRYYPNDPDKVADKVLDELYPTAQQQADRKRDSFVQGARYEGPPPSELYETIR